MLMALLVVVLLCAQCLLVTCDISDYEVQVSPATAVAVDECQGRWPSVKIATRYATTREEQFGGWNLTLFTAGDTSCSGQLIHNVRDGVYQFRVELSPADSRCCINVKADLIDNNWCTENVIERRLCSNRTTTTTFLSQPIFVSATVPDLLKPCSDFAMRNGTDIAVAHEGRFNSCSSCSFPLATLDSKKVLVTISFSLIMMYSRNSESGLQCLPHRGLENEGILLRTNMQDLHFYCSQASRISLNGSCITLNDGQQEITVPSTQNMNTGLLNFTLNNTDIVNKVNVSLSWEQRAISSVKIHGEWALDNVRVNLHYNSCTRTLLNEEFMNSASATEWIISGGSITIDDATSGAGLPSSRCNCLGSSNCIYFDEKANREATTPSFDTTIVTAVRPPLAPTNHSADTCEQNNYTSVTVRFELSMRLFQYPTPCNDESPNGIMLAMGSASPTPMAYFTPLANTNWKNFTTYANDSSYLLIDGVVVPVYSTEPNELIEIKGCVFTEDTEMLSIGWRQEYYVEEQDYWYLNISNVQIDDIVIDNINDQDIEDKRYTVNNQSQSNNESGCFDNYTFKMTEDTNRFVQLVFNLTEIRSVPPTSPPNITQTQAPSPTTTTITTASFMSPSMSPSMSLSTTLSAPPKMSSSSITPSITPTPVPSIENIIDMDPVGGLMMLLEQNDQDNVDNTRRLDLLRRAFTAQSSTNNITDMFIETSLRVVQDGIDEAVISNDTGRGLLYLLDDVALSLRRDVFINITNIVLKVQEVSVSNNSVLGIATENSYITLPSEVFSTMTGPSFVASYYFKNISNLLPGDQPISPVLSASLFCNGCRISNLTQNVSIFFPSTTSGAEIRCETTDNQSSFINNSFWSSAGCYTNNFPNGSVLCSCNHLTHFAILLSPGVEIPPADAAALTIIGQVFVTISLIFLLATILVFVINRALWSMRNYIHVMLCANMFVAQLLFVVGVERIENTVVCSVIAVLLHYMFLVVFMWMLMEGVVLYVALVRVFIKHPGRYIAGYTIASYGVPLVYMAFVVPIGFLVNTDDIGHHYGYYNDGTLAACWLRYDTHFIWAFITPVIIIILANIGFLIMALVIMYRHFKKQQKKSEIAKAWHWVKVILALVSVMGIAWIGNLLFFDVSLLFVAYIMTIFIAGQGIIIFILFVPLSEQVRHAYLKWWKKRVSQSSFLTKHFTTRPTSLNATTTTSVSVQHNNTPANAAPAVTEENVYVMTNCEAGRQESSSQESPTDVEVNEKVVYLKNELAESDNDDSDDESN